MHSALSLAEIQRSVFSFDLSRKDFFHVAQTCHDLHESALDSLWAELTTLRPLLRLLGDLKSSNGVLKKKPRLKLDFQHPILERWDRFIFYADRVRCLKFETTFAEFVAPTAWATIGHFKPRIHLLPNLRRVIFKHPKDLDDYLLLASFGPEVREITYGDSDDQAAGYHFAVIARQSRSLTKLTLCGSNFNPSTTCTQIGKLKHLRELHAANQIVTDTFLASLAGMAELRVLKLGQYHPNKPPSLKDVFINLQELSMSSTEDGVILLLSDDPTLPKLRKLRITAGVSKSPSIEINELFFTRIAQFAIHARDVRVEMTASGDDEINCACLRAFRICTSLEHLHVHSAYNLRCSSDEVRESFSQWPGLRTLYLNSHSTTLRMDRVLGAAGDHLPMLSKLSVPFVDAAPWTDVEPQELRNLQVFDLLWSFVPEKAEETAAFLTHQVPEETTITADEAGKWEKILSLRASFHAYRRVISEWVQPDETPEETDSAEDNVVDSTAES